jgi:hypothetical protein
MTKLSASVLQPAPKRGLRQVARQDALWLVWVGRLKVEVSTLSVSYTVTVGRYYYKYRNVSLYSRIQINNVIACIKNQVLPSIRPAIMGTI